MERQYIVRKRLLLTVTALLVAGFLTTNLVSFHVSRLALKTTILHNELPLTSSNIYSEIQADLLRPIFISSLMAHDTFLRDWLLAGERDVDKITRYLNEFRAKYDVFTSYLISDKTQQYYHFSGPTKKVSEADGRDVWFFRVKAMTEPYEINIDYNQAQGNDITIFINYKIFDYAGNFIGVTGVGLKLDAVARIIARYSGAFSRTVYFVDRSGRITVRSNPSESPPGSLDENIRSAPGVRDIADRLLTTADGHFEYSLRGESMLVTSRLIKELGWYVVVEQREADIIVNLWRGFLTNIAIGLVIILITITAIAYTINIYHRRLEALATTDKLTGIPNRQSFDSLIEYAIRLRKRAPRPLSVILFDIDQFKEVNDTLGHLKGDEAIQSLVAVVKGRLRETDVPCRWGGDEFMVLLEGCPLEQALAVAEDLRAAVGAHAVLPSEPDRRITISAGVADLHEGDNLDTLVSRADRALYQAKAQGRNRVLAAGAGSEPNPERPRAGARVGALAQTG
ncbi:MAG: diguanylate cyclase [Azospirillum sp.]|nr:diguanylate cyclase [Azospirillum sp.]